MFLKTVNKLLVGLSLLVSASVFAAPITIDLRNIPSHTYEGDPDNFVGYVDVGANATITGISYDLNITAFGPGFLSDMVVSFFDSDKQRGVYFSPGFAEHIPGTASYIGSADLVDLGLAFKVGADGMLRVEFYQNNDSIVDAADGVWNFGSFTFVTDLDDTPAPVPEPASALLLAAGLVTMRYAGRRAARKAAAAAH